MTVPSPFCSSTCRRRCTWSSPPAKIHQLPLARLRARGQLTELRAADLRFTPSEAADFLNAGDGSQPLGGRHRRTGRPHRRLDCRPAIGRAVPAGPPGCFRVHPGLRGRPPVHRGLSGRRGPAASAGGCPQLLTPDRHSRPVDRPAVRCRHRPGGRRRAAGGPGARQLLCRAAG